MKDLIFSTCCIVVDKEKAWLFNSICLCTDQTCSSSNASSYVLSRQESMQIQASQRLGFQYTPSRWWISISCSGQRTTRELDPLEPLRGEGLNPFMQPGV